MQQQEAGRGRMGFLLPSFGALGRGRLTLWFPPTSHHPPLQAHTLPQPQSRAQGTGFPTVTFLPP